MRLIDADELKQRALEIWQEAPVVLRMIDEAPTIDTSDAYVRGYNAGVQMSIKLFLSIGGEDDDSVQM